VGFPFPELAESIRERQRANLSFPELVELIRERQRGGL
jgi:hypothetical protein